MYVGMRLKLISNVKYYLPRTDITVNIVNHKLQTLIGIQCSITVEH